MGPEGAGVDAGGSVVSVESNKSTRCDCRIPGKNFASPPTDLGGRVGGLPPLPASVVGVVGVRLSTGARRSSSSSSSSSEERPSSWKSAAPTLERIVPIPSVCMQVWDAVSKGRKERKGISIRDSRGERKQWMVSIGLRFRRKYQETPLGVDCSEV